MNPKARLLAAALALTAAFFTHGCSTPSSRISSNKAAFNAYPADVQAKIREGKVEVGFTTAMVKMALGEPDRRYTRATEKGTSHIWAYRDRRPSIGFGIGVGGGSGSTSVGTGVGVSSGGDYRDDKLRVVLVDDKVTAIERMTK